MNFLPPETYIAVRCVGSPRSPESPDTPAEGVVVAVGPSADFLPSQIKVGDRVYFNERAGFEIAVEGEALFLVEEAALLHTAGLSCSTSTS